MGVKQLQQFLKISLILGLWGLAGGCGRFSGTTEKLAEDSQAVQRLDSNLIFDDVTLEQMDEQGRLLWKVYAKQASYSKDQKVALVQSPEGELFQDGKLVYRIKATTGEVQQDGQQIFLKGEIVATDVQDGAVLKGKELEWRPKEDLLIVRNNLTGTHSQVDAVAQEAKVFSRARRMELSGGVIANTKDPALELRTEHLVWQMADQLVIGDRPMQIDRYVNGTATDRATADLSEVNLKTKTVTLKKNAQLALSEPPLQIASETMVWNLDQQMVVSDQPVNVVHQEQQVNLTANQGRLDLAQRIFYLTGNVKGIGQRNQSNLNADQLTWNIPTEEVLAEGNVAYQQANPPLNLKGSKAVGQLQGQTLVVSGGSSDGRVVTEIIP